MDCILVTGGAGFIGSNFVRLALERTSARIVVVDQLTYAGSLESLRDLERLSRFDFVRADIADRAALEVIFREHQPTWIANFAAESHVDRSIDGPRPFLQSNAVGAFELLEASRRYLTGKDRALRERFRFLHVSTDEVYGSLGKTGRFKETTPYAPRSPYSASKAAADHFVQAYHATYGLPTLLTNCSNNYGPYQFPEKLIPVLILNAIEGKPLPIYGDGQNVRDWLYVGDHCEGLLRVLERGRVGEKYNLGGNEERTNLEIVERVCAHLDRLYPTSRNPNLAGRGMERYEELKTFVDDRPGHDRRYAVDTAKIRRELDWSPAHDLDSGLADTVRWYLEHRDWCEAVSGDYQRERLGLTTEPKSSEAR
jgi:dTDP-glucose 4,6-dehydratase